MSTIRLDSRLRHSPSRAPRGVAIVVMVVLLLVLNLVVIGAVLAGSRDHDIALRRVENVQAFYAAEACANMSMREFFNNTDYDADGVIGSVSNDNNSNNNPALGVARLYASASTSGSTTTVTVHGTRGDARRDIQAQLQSAVSTVNTGTILFVVVNSASLDVQESARKTLMESWGYTVVPISNTESQAAFDAAFQTSSCVYVCETVLSGTVSTKLTNTTLGVVNEESALSDELGFAQSMTTMTDYRVDVINTSHYITSTLSSGTVSLFSANQPIRYMSGTQGGYTLLGHSVSTAFPTFAVMERGATLYPSGSAAGRRVYLPWGNTNTDINQLTADGLTIMKRAIEWVLMPIAHWKLDDASGSTAVDSVNSYNGTLTGPAWATGRINGGVTFDGFNDYLSIPSNAQFQVTTAFSVAGWIKASAWTSSTWVSPILRKGDANPGNWQLAIKDGKLTMFLDDYDDYGIRANTVLSTNAWIHVAGTWDGSYVKLYVNGVADMTPYARAAPIGTDTRALYIGGRISNTDVSNATLDDVRFYNRALTVAEVQALCNTEPTLTSWRNSQP